MSVVRVKSKITRSNADFEANSQSISSLIYTSAREETLEEFSIELHLGNGWNEFYSQYDKQLRKIEKSIVIGKGKSIVVEVEEEIKVPCNRYGIVLPTGSLFLARGVLLTAAKVEPSFHGKLKVRLYNTSSYKVEIKPGEKIGSVVFFSTQTTLPMPPISRTSDVSDFRLRYWVKAWRWSATNWTQLVSWLIPTLIPLTVLALTWHYYYQPTLDKAIASSQGPVSTPAQTPAPVPGNPSAKPGSPQGNNKQR